MNWSRATYANDKALWKADPGLASGAAIVTYKIGQLAVHALRRAVNQNARQTIAPRREAPFQTQTVHPMPMPMQHAQQPMQPVQMQYARPMPPAQAMPNYGGNAFPYASAAPARFETPQHPIHVDTTPAFAGPAYPYVQTPSSPPPAVGARMEAPWSPLMSGALPSIAPSSPEPAPVSPMRIPGRDEFAEIRNQLHYSNFIQPGDLHTPENQRGLSALAAAASQSHVSLTALLNGAMDIDDAESIAFYLHPQVVNAFANVERAAGPRATTAAVLPSPSPSTSASDFSPVLNLSSPVPTTFSMHSNASSTTLVNMPTEFWSPFRPLAFVKPTTRTEAGRHQPYAVEVEDDGSVT